MEMGSVRAASLAGWREAVVGLGMGRVPWISGPLTHPSVCH